MKTPAKPKPKTTRAKPSTQRLEIAVTGVNRALDRLVRMIEREGAKFTPEQIGKAFNFLSMATDAGRQKAQAAAHASSLSSFSLNMNLPAQPAPAGGPVSPAWNIAAQVAPAPTVPPGASVQSLGGRLVKEVRAQHRPGDDRHLPSPADGGDIEFLDDDETDTADETEND